LTAEVEALDEARRALREGDPVRALKTVDDYERVLHGSRLRDEATILRIEALERSGQRGAAAKLAAEFVANNPNSPLVDRARGLVSSGHESLETRGAGGGGDL
jgi:outer membrane protein assembly factor BamD (BamD/ComL family)